MKFFCYFIAKFFNVTTTVHIIKQKFIRAEKKKIYRTFCIFMIISEHNVFNLKQLEISEDSLLSYAKKCYFSVHRQYIFSNVMLFRDIYLIQHCFSNKEGLGTHDRGKKKQIRNRYCIFLRVK